MWVQALQGCVVSGSARGCGLTRADVMHSKREPKELGLGVDRTVHIHPLRNTLGIEPRHCIQQDNTQTLNVHVALAH